MVVDEVSEGKVLELVFLVADLKPNMWQRFRASSVLRPSLFVRVMNNTDRARAGPW